MASAVCSRGACASVSCAGELGGGGVEEAEAGDRIAKVESRSGDGGKTSSMSPSKYSGEAIGGGVAGGAGAETLRPSADE